MAVRFTSKLVAWNYDLGHLAEDTIRQMPMLYRADLQFALEKIPLLWEFVRALPVNPFSYKYQSLDVKVTMLKKGWYPCIPGWHCDDFYRGANGQPDVENLAQHNSTHFIAVFGDNSLTEFIGSGFRLLVESTPNEIFYGRCNTVIETANFFVPKSVILPNHLYEFDSMTFHRGMPATHDGWRAFVRLTLGDVREPKNEIRTQVQVYVPSDKLEAGW